MGMAEFLCSICLQPLKPATLLLVCAAMLFAIISPGHADGAANWQAVDLKVLKERTDTMLADYYEKIAEAKSQATVSKVPPAEFSKKADSIRKQYIKSLMMPDNYPKAIVKHEGDLEIDGVRVEKQLINTRPGIYSMALVYNPAGKSADSKKYPTMLMLPGHGDPGWAGGVQQRCLSFAKKGYLVMFVEPFGQMERGDNFRWNEYHGSLTASYFMTVGESLLGCIMADHISEITYLLNRPDVDQERLALGGVSMGGTHTLWLAALDTRIKASAAVSAAPVNQPIWAMRHHCICDTIWDAYSVLPDDFLRSLCAPRAYMNIFPSTEWPTTVESQRSYINGDITAQEMSAKYSLTENDINQLAPYAREVYRLANAADRYKMTVVEGPHDFNAPMRETAAGWFAFAFKETQSIIPIPEPPMNPITDRKKAIPLLNFWTVDGPPKDALNPTEYLKSKIAKKLAKIEKLQTDAASLKTIKTKVKGLLKADISAKAQYQETEIVKAGDLTVHKIRLATEPGITLPMLVLEPVGKNVNEGILIMSPSSKEQVLETGLPEKLSREGKWVAILEPRGIGETTSVRGDGAYTGVFDLVAGIAAIKIGQTLAGQWTRDMIAGVTAFNSIAGKGVKITVRGERQCGFVAILAGAYDKRVSEVETVDMLASYYSPRGYGLPYIYSNDMNKRPEIQTPGGWKSMLPSIPCILDTADIPQIAAMVAPKPLKIIAPKYADDRNVPADDIGKVFGWLTRAYASAGKPHNLKITASEDSL